MLREAASPSSATSGTAGAPQRRCGAPGGRGGGARDWVQDRMSDTTENAATRLWRDRVQLREQERNEARARFVEEKVAVLTAENDQIAAENARLRDLSDRLAIK